MSSLWSDNRCDLETKLKLLSPPLADLYKTVIDTLDDDSEHISSSSASIIGHCMREIMNNLYDALFPDSTYPSRAELRGKRDQAERSIRELWEKSGERNGAASDLSDVVSCEEAVNAFKMFCQEEENRERVNDQKLSMLLLGKEQRGHPSLAAWRSAQKFFVAKAHGPASNKTVLKSTVLTHVTMVENCISSRLGLFFNVATEIEIILGKANELNGEGFASPDKELINTAILSLSSPEHRRIFFNGLNNPYWVAPLNREGYFVNCAPVTIDSYEAWPEGKYLLRMSSHVPEDVKRVLEEMLDLHIPAVTHTAIECLPHLPEDLVKSIEKEIISQIKSKIVASLTLDDIEALCAHMSELIKGTEKRKKRGSSLFFLMFDAYDSGDGTVQGHRSELVSNVPSYFYNEFVMSALKDADNSTKARLIKRLAKNYDKRMCSKKGAFPESLESHYYRAEIAKADPYSNHVLGDALIDTYRDLLVNECFGNATILDDAWQTDSVLVRRVALYALGCHIANDADGKLSHNDSYLILAQSIVDDALNLIGTFDPELFPFLEACFLWSGAIVFDNLYEGIPFFRSQMYEKAASRQPLDSYESDNNKAYADNYADIEEYRLLCLIGEKHIPASLRNLFEKHRNEFGNISFSSRIGPSVTVSFEFASPLDAQELLAIPTAELVKILHEWEPERDGFDAPSRYGLSIQLYEASARNPEIASGVLSKLASSETEYISRLLLGIDRAMDSDMPAPIEEILLSIEKWLDEDQPNYGLLASGIRIMVRAIQKNRCNEELTSRISRIFEKAFYLPGIVEDEAKWSNNLERMTEVAQNALRPSVLIAIVKSASSVADGASQEGLLLLFFKLAAQYNSLPLASAIGQSMEQVIMLNNNLAVANRDVLFGEVSNNRFQIYALETALRSNRYSRDLTLYFYPIVCSALLYKDAEDTEKQHDEGKRGLVILLGFLLLNGYLNRLIEFSDFVFQEWLGVASGDERAVVLDGICHLGGSEETPEHLVKLVQRYWDYRANAVKSGGNPAELVGIFSLANNSAIGLDWLIPRMQFEAYQAPHPKEAALVFGRLAEASNVYPAEILEIVSALYNSSKEYDYLFRHSILDVVIPALANALDSGDKSLIWKAKNLMNSLGEAGFIDLDKQVNEFRKTN